MSMQGAWQATQALCTLPFSPIVRHIDWVMRELVSRWAGLPKMLRGPVITVYTGPIGQKY
jgi:hypothetical protein